MAFDKIRKIIAKNLSISEEKVTMEADFVDDLQADSLDITLLMKTISEEFDIAVEDDAVDKISTVGDAVEFIEAYMPDYKDRIKILKGITLMVLTLLTLLVCSSMESFLLIFFAISLIAIGTTE